jgi:hypothetical protein
MPVERIRRPTVLPYVNPQTGILKLDNPTVQEKILVNYSNYSYNYWLGVKERQKIYRLVPKLSTPKGVQLRTASAVKVP